MIKKSSDHIFKQNSDLIFKYFFKSKKVVSKKKRIFSYLHKKINKKQVNEFRVNAINLINRNTEFRNLYYNSAKELLDDGNEIAMQKKLIYLFKCHLIQNQCYKCILIFMLEKVL